MKAGTVARVVKYVRNNLVSLLEVDCVNSTE